VVLCSAADAGNQVEAACLDVAVCEYLGAFPVSADTLGVGIAFVLEKDVD